MFRFPESSVPNPPPTLVLYHADCPDGFGAAWLYWRRLGDQVRCLPVAHGDEPPQVGSCEDVLLVDFAYPRSQTLELAAQARSLRILDHHASAAQDLAGIEYAHVDLSRSGVGLAWQDLYGEAPAPLLVRCVEDRDLHRWSEQESQDILSVLDTIPRRFEDWDAFFERTCTDPRGVARQGRTMRVRFEASAERMLAHSLPVSILGFKGLAVNAPPEFADYVASALATRADFGLTWFLDARGRVCASFRSKKINVIPLAGEFGGGGHPSAAGARLRFEQLAELVGIG